MSHVIRRIPVLLTLVSMATATSLVAGVAPASAKPRDPAKPAVYCYYAGTKYSPGATIRMGNTLRYCDFDGTWREMWDQ